MAQVHLPHPGDAVDGGDHVGELEAETGVVQRGLVQGHRGGQLVDQRALLVHLLLRDQLLLDQLGVPLQVPPGVLEIGLVTPQRRLRLLDRDLERAGIDTAPRVALFTRLPSWNRMSTRGPLTRARTVTVASGVTLPSPSSHTGTSRCSTVATPTGTTRAWPAAPVAAGLLLRRTRTTPISANTTRPAIHHQRRFRARAGPWATTGTGASSVDRLSAVRTVIPGDPVRRAAWRARWRDCTAPARAGRRPGSAAPGHRSAR